MESFKGRRVLVTGAGKGIGREVARRLAERGAAVVALSRSADDLASLRDEAGCETVTAALEDIDATVAALVEGCTEDRPSAVLHPGGQPGAPACFPASCFAALSALRGDRGAGALLGNAVTIPAPPAELADVDRPQDLSAG